jgi:outer membrane protein, heavy metal efflux system
MALVPRAGYCARIAIPLLLTAGCGLARPTAAPQPASERASVASSNPAPDPPIPHPRQSQDGVQQVSHRLPIAESPEPVADDGLFTNQAELSLPQLTDLVLARNASLQAMTFAWRSATERFPQAIALDDPMFMGMIAPGSVNAATVETGYVVGASQKLPWFGKRTARGAAAQADASAMFHDVRDARLQLAQTTRMAFFEYYLVVRELEINHDNLQLTREFRDTAQSKYENNQVTQQDVLQADVEFATTRRRLLELSRMKRIAIARLNTLLRRNPDRPIPSPPSVLSNDLQLPSVESLRQLAVTQRPDLAALGARVQAEQAAVTLAQKQFYPDAEFYGKYDTFWQPASTQGPLRGQVGVNVNMPIYGQKRNAALCEAQFRLSQRRAEYNQKFVDVQFDVESAYAQIHEAQQAIILYRDSLLPASEQTVATTRTNYDVGTTTFLNVLTAQQQLLMQREQYQQALAALHSRLAELDRAVGGLPQSNAIDEVPRPSMQ